jgi:hypothetical protein
LSLGKFWKSKPFPACKGTKFCSIKQGFGNSQKSHFSYGFS